MSEKKKKKNPAFEPKNLIVMAIAGVAVILVAVTLRMLVPTNTRESSSGFDAKAWEEAVNEAASSVSAEQEPMDVGLTKVYNEEAVPTVSPSVPTEEAIPTEAGQSENFVAPVSGAVTKDYSGEELVYSETMQDWRTHNGIDFSAEEGLDVYAAGNGTVEAVTDNGMMGKTVIVLHSGGVRTIYSNLADIDLVAVGDNVMQGAIIGKAGSTAVAEVSEPPHIHFEMSVNEEYVNPHDYIKTE